MAMSEDGWGISARADATGKQSCQEEQDRRAGEEFEHGFLFQDACPEFPPGRRLVGTVARLALHEGQEDTMDIFDDEKPDTDRSRPLAVIVLGANTECVPAVAEGARRGIEVAAGDVCAGIAVDGPFIFDDLKSFTKPIVVHGVRVKNQLQSVSNMAGMSVTFSIVATGVVSSTSL